MKKRLVAILFMAVILTMTACGNSNSAEESAESGSLQTETAHHLSDTIA